MYFCLTNRPATFQTMMNDIFKGLIDKGYITIYMDDILIFTWTIEHHREVVSCVVLGKFGLVRSLPIFARPQTGWSGP